MMRFSDPHCRDLSYTGVSGSVPWGVNSLEKLQTLYGTPGVFCNDNATCPAAGPLPPPENPANPTSPAVKNSSSPGSASSSAPNTTCHMCQSYCLGCSSSASVFSSSPCHSSPPASSSALSPGAIAGIVVAAFIALIAVALLLWFLLRPSEPGESHGTAAAPEAGASAGVCRLNHFLKSRLMFSPIPKSQVKAMARLQHPALVPLLGYCIDYNETSRQMEQIIVSQFMPNGDLSHWTTAGAKPLSPHEPLLLHALLSPHSRTSQGPSPSQTLGLLISPYSDASPRGESQVAAFGVLVLELLTGRDPILSVDGSQSHIREWATAELSSSDVSSIIDPRMPSPAASTDDVSMAHADVMQSLASLALECTAMPAASRPSMAKVLSQLKQLHEEVVKREGESGLEGSEFVGVEMGAGGVGGVGKEKWESLADGASAVSVTPVMTVRDTTGSLEGNESSSAGEGTSGEASGSMAGYRN
ncbi:unnamed protein product [Closterium sp. Naga37s-1]|nr:unnamed protein product [Closterium sp. Naga37s-1]